MMVVPHLPAEIWDKIVDHIPDANDINILALPAHHVTTRTLWSLCAAPELQQVVIGHPRSFSMVNRIRVPQVTVICSFEDEDGCRVEPRHNKRGGLTTVGLVSPGGAVVVGNRPAECKCRNRGSCIHNAWYHFHDWVSANALSGELWSQFEDRQTIY